MLTNKEIKMIATTAVRESKKAGLSLSQAKEIWVTEVKNTADYESAAMVSLEIIKLWFKK